MGSVINSKKALMSAYTLMKGKYDRSPLSSLLSKSRYTLGAFANFDHDDTSSLIGTTLNHDTVTVIIQECSPEDELSRKPKICEC